MKFITTANEQAAFAAAQPGQAHLVIGITTQSTLDQAKAHFQVPVTLGTQTQTLVFNTKGPLFDNLTAREAMAYAINSKELLDVVSPGFGLTVEAEAGPGGLSYQETVPGFRHYDLGKAKQLVQQLGGLSAVLTHSTNTAVFATLGPAIGNQLTAAGIQVTYRTTTPAQATAMYSAPPANSWSIRQRRRHGPGYERQLFRDPLRHQRDLHLLRRPQVGRSDYAVGADSLSRPTQPSPSSPAVSGSQLPTFHVGA